MLVGAMSFLPQPRHTDTCRNQHGTNTLPNLLTVCSVVVHFCGYMPPSQASAPGLLPKKTLPMYFCRHASSNTTSLGPWQLKVLSCSGPVRTLLASHAPPLSLLVDFPTNMPLAKAHPNQCHNLGSTYRDKHHSKVTNAKGRGKDYHTQQSGYNPSSELRVGISS